MKNFFSNPAINRLAVHTTLVWLAWSLAGIFFIALLFRAGLSLAQIFIVIAAILALRFALRTLVMMIAPAIGLRRTLIFGTLLSALQFPAIAFVHGVGPELVLFCIISSLSQVFYWTCYHAIFSSLGDVEHRGKQIGIRQAFSTLAGVIGPVIGGLILTTGAAWMAFALAFVVQIAAVVPLLHVDEPKVAKLSPPGGFTAARPGVLLFFADGWIQNGSATAWTIITFQALAERFDSYGGLLAVATVAGSLGGMVLGRYIDLGHARRSVKLNAAILAISLLLKASCNGEPAAVFSVTIATTFFSGLYLPYWMTAVYNASKNAPCTFRFHFAAEGGWDAGGVSVCLIAAAMCAAHISIEAVILLALPMVAVQALLVNASYQAENGVRTIS